VRGTEELRSSFGDKYRDIERSGTITAGDWLETGGRVEDPGQRNPQAEAGVAAIFKKGSAHMRERAHANGMNRQLNLKKAASEECRSDFAVHDPKMEYGRIHSLFLL
jgi:hypothetical protein